MNVPSVVTQNGRKYVPIQTISPVPLSNSSAQKRYRKQNHGSIVLTSSPYVNEVKEKATERERRS
jgi:hypothetical protein